MYIIRFFHDGRKYSVFTTSMDEVGMKHFREMCSIYGIKDANIYYILIEHDGVVFTGSPVVSETGELLGVRMLKH